MSIVAMSVSAGVGQATIHHRKSATDLWESLGSRSHSDGTVDWADTFISYAGDERPYLPFRQIWCETYP